MNLAVLNTQVQDFINSHLDGDPAKIALNPPEIPGVEGREIAEQLASKQKCRYKLPRWYHTEGIYYPKKINIEQTSSEQTAAYKASIVKAGKILDMTGGFGVDSFYLARDADKLDYCERNPELCSIATYNFKQLGANNIITHCTDGLAYLKENREHFDLIYIDPSRRSEVKGKVFLLTDCEPNVPENLQTILERSATLLVKTSPLLDIKIGMDELDAVASIHVVALDNEVKELLWEIRPGYVGAPGIHCINLKGDSTEVWNFSWGAEAEASPDYGQPRKFLYEPNAAIMKSGAFKLIATDFNLLKLHEHSHLYTSDELISFPGRRFQVNSVIPYSRKNLKDTGIYKANITTRNFPESVQQIRKKTKITDGGDRYLFFTKDPDNKLLVVNCSKI